MTEGVAVDDEDMVATVVEAVVQGDIIITRTATVCTLAGIAIPQDPITLQPLSSKICRMDPPQPALDGVGL